MIHDSRILADRVTLPGGAEVPRPSDHEGHDADRVLSAETVGQRDVMVRVRTGDGGQEEASRFWIWAAIDNLKFGALNAVACAQELRKLRPQGKVQ